MTVEPDFKRGKRIVDKDAGKAKVRAEGICRVCERVPAGTYFDALTRFHLVPKGQGGDDVDENLIPICGSGVTGCHAILDDRRDSGLTDACHPFTFAEAASTLRARLLDEEAAYAVGAKGEAWLDWRLPL